MSSMNSTGTTLHICATLPATFDEAGFEALVFSKIGEITAIEGDVGRTYSTSTHVPLETGATYSHKGAFDPGAYTAPLAIDRDDAGQVIAQAALAARSDYAFKIVERDGTCIYHIGMVTGFPTSYGSTESITTGTIAIKINPNAAGLDFVIVAP